MGNLLTGCLLDLDILDEVCTNFRPEEQGERWMGRRWKTHITVAVGLEESTIGPDKSERPNRSLTGIGVSFRPIPPIW